MKARKIDACDTFNNPNSLRISFLVLNIKIIFLHFNRINVDTDVQTHRFKDIQTNGIFGNIIIFLFFPTITFFYSPALRN